MKSKEPTLPELNQNIIEAIESGNLIIFIGAGVSALYGYPTWNGLAKKLLGECLKKKKISRSEKEILDSFDSSQKVTIACERLGKSGVNSIVEIFNKISKDNEGNENNRKKIERIAGYLSAYNCQIITTNADDSLDEVEPFKSGSIEFSFRDLNMDDFNDVSLIHLHGSIKKPKDMIFTAKEYAKAYRVVDKEFGSKLAQLLNGNKTILFIGYGLAEFELIKYFISDVETKNPNRFFLNGYLDKDTIKRQFDEEYYRSLGIELIPFSREENGYDALINVLEKWDKTIKEETYAHLRVPKIIHNICIENPTKNGIKELNRFLKDDKKTVINSLVSSPHLDEYLLKLRDNELLFSIKDNLKPCIKEDEGYRSSVWEGLELIEAYAKNISLDNEKVNEFVIELINQIIQVLAKEKKKDYHKRFSSSFIIMTTIWIVICSKTEFIEKTDVKTFVRQYLDNPLCRDSSISYYIQENRENYEKVNSKVVFEIFKSLLENNNEDSDGYRNLFGNNVSTFIRNNPSLYFEYAKKTIEKNKKPFLSMGAVEEYTSSSIYSVTKEDVCLNWFKQASKYIDRNYKQRIINNYLQRKNRLLFNIAVYLISNSFEEFDSLFYKKTKTIIKDHNAYSDFRCLIEKNVKKIINDEKASYMIDALEKTAIDVKGKLIENRLKNHIYGLFNKKGYLCPYKKETEDDLLFIKNYNKLVSLDYSGIDDDVKKYYERELFNLSFDDILRNYDSKTEKSYYLDSRLNMAIIKYIDEKKIDILKYTNKMPTGLSDYLIDHYVEGKDIIKLLRFTEKYYENKVPSKESLPVYLRMIAYLLNNRHSKEAATFTGKIDYKEIEFQNEMSDSSIVDYLINETIYNYYDILTIQIKEGSLSKELLYDSIEYVKKKNKAWKIKAIMATFISRIYSFDEEYAKSNIGFIFNNRHKGFNPSYHALILNSSISFELIGQLINRKSLLSFFKEEVEDVGHTSAKCLLAEIVVKYYLCTGKSLGVVTKCVELSFRLTANELLRYLDKLYNSENEPDINKRIINVLSEIHDKRMIEKLPDKYEYDQLSRSLSKLICLTGNKESFMWEMLIFSFTHFDRYFFDETAKLVDSYKIIEKANVSKLLDIYFERSSKNYFSSDTLLKVYSLIKNEKVYKREAKKWGVIITKNNPDIKL